MHVWYVHENSLVRARLMVRAKVPEVMGWCPGAPFGARGDISPDIVIPSLALFSFVMLYYLFCDVCSDTLTCLFCILYD